jgi:hypothetical protein
MNSKIEWSFSVMINYIGLVSPSNSSKSLNFTSAAAAAAAAAAATSSTSAAKMFCLYIQTIYATPTRLLRTRLIAAMSVPSRLAALRLFMKVFPPLGSSDDSKQRK